MGLTAHKTSIYLLKVAVVILILMLLCSLFKVYKQEHNNKPDYLIKITIDSVKIIDPISMKTIYQENLDSDLPLSNAIKVDNE